MKNKILNIEASDWMQNALKDGVGIDVTIPMLEDKLVPISSPVYGRRGQRRWKCNNCRKVNRLRGRTRMSRFGNWIGITTSCECGVIGLVYDDRVEAIGIIEDTHSELKRGVS